MNKLDAMKHAIMNGATGVTMSRPTAQLQSNPSQDQTIARLKAMLGQEHKLRLDAEARLRGVLAAVAKRTAKVKPAARPDPQAARATPAPVAASVAAPPMATVIDLSDVRAAIQRIGGDEPEGEEEAI